MSKDMVKRPDHYCFSKFEPKDVIREWGLNFNLGSAVKYIARAGRKDDIVQDLKKAREFLSFEIEALEAERGHEAMLEHFSFSVKFTVDRGVSHELVRHRIASFAQESTRYCNYGHEGEISVIEPFYLKECRSKEPWKYNAWVEACCKAEDRYLCLLEWGASPQEARAVLPNSLKTEIVVTANLREWRNIFKLRAVGVTGKPHPQMLEVMVPLLEEVKRQIPVVFDDLVTE